MTRNFIKAWHGRAGPGCPLSHGGVLLDQVSAVTKQALSGSMRVSGLLQALLYSTFGGLPLSYHVLNQQHCNSYKTVPTC